MHITLFLQVMYCFVACVFEWIQNISYKSMQIALSKVIGTHLLNKILYNNQFSLMCKLKQSSEKKNQVNKV